MLCRWLSFGKEILLFVNLFSHISKIEKKIKKTTAKRNSDLLKHKERCITDDPVEPKTAKRLIMWLPLKELHS